MGITCLVRGHDTDSGEQKIEVEDLWHNVVVYYCNRCDEIVVDPSQGEREHDKILGAAEEVLDDPSQYNEWTVSAAKKVKKKL